HSTAAGGRVRAFLYRDGKMSELGTLDGEGSTAYGINSRGRIVGSWTIKGSERHAFLYADGKVIDLNALLPANSGWTLPEAQAINDHSQIVGVGQFQGKSRAYLLSPKAP